MWRRPVTILYDDGPSGIGRVATRLHAPTHSPCLTFINAIYPFLVTPLSHQCITFNLPLPFQNHSPGKLRVSSNRTTLQKLSIRAPVLPVVMGIAMVPLCIKSSAASELVPFTDQTNIFMIRTTHVLLSTNVTSKTYTNDRLTTPQNINGYLIFVQIVPDIYDATRQHQTLVDKLL